MTSEADVELTHESQDPLHKELPELLLEPLHHHNLDICSDLNLQCALEGTEHGCHTQCSPGHMGDQSSSTFQCMDGSMF